MTEVIERHAHTIASWYHEKAKIFLVISGYAGTGKTYNARKIGEFLNIPKHRIAYITPTGKSAMVLGNAKTVHSFLYIPVVDEKTKKLTFTKRETLSIKSDYDLIIADEISMVPQEILEDLRELGVPIIALGDPAQLKPVNGTTNILDKPDIFLTHIYRNDGGIIELSKDIRENGFVDVETAYDGVDYYFDYDKDTLIEEYLENKSIFITKTNRSRKFINSMVREALQYNDILVKGEEIIGLKNNYEYTDSEDNIFFSNGLPMVIDEVLKINEEDSLASLKVHVTSRPHIKWTITVDLRPLMGIEVNTYEMNRKVMIYNGFPVDYSKLQKVYRNHMNGKEVIPDKKKLMSLTMMLARGSVSTKNVSFIDYGYALTCHKAQGSEYQNVALINEGANHTDHHRWLYTGVTRAKHKLNIYFPRAKTAQYADSNNSIDAYEQWVDAQ